MSCCLGQGWSVGGPSFQDYTRGRSPLASSPGVPSSPQSSVNTHPRHSQHHSVPKCISGITHPILEDSSQEGGWQGRSPHAEALTRGTAKDGHVGNAPCASAGTNRWQTNKTRSHLLAGSSQGGTAGGANWSSFIRMLIPP